jgi:hypothetical protein
LEKILLLGTLVYRGDYRTIPDSSESEGTGVKADVAAARLIANRAGLGTTTGAGTVARVASNVIDNGKDVNRLPGASSNTSLGDLKPAAKRDEASFQSLVDRIPK